MEAQRDSEPSSILSEIWEVVYDTYGASEQFCAWSPELLNKFSTEVLAAVPGGSVFLSGTDPGRFVISGCSESHNEGRPFFTVAHNSIGKIGYLTYLREMYGSKLNLPSDEDARRIFHEYIDDLRRRSVDGQLQEGENITMTDVKTTVTGPISAKVITERMVRLILKTNPERQFYVEDGFSFEGLRSHLLPLGGLECSAGQPTTLRR